MPLRAFSLALILACLMLLYGVHQAAMSAMQPFAKISVHGRR